MIDTGWVKVYRKIMVKGYYKKSQYVHLWLHLLLKASHNETEFMWNGKIEKLQPGQFVTGRKQLSAETGISQTTIERILNLLESEQQIGQQKTNKYRLLTVINWDEYQGTRHQKQQPADNQPTTKQQPADTFKKVKNVRMKEIKSMSPTLEELKSYIQEKKYNVIAEKFLAYYESNGWMVGKNKMKSWKAALVTWHHGNYGTPKKQSTAWGGIRPNESVQEPELTEAQIRERTIKRLEISIAEWETYEKEGGLDEPSKKRLEGWKKELAELQEG